MSVAQRPLGMVCAINPPPRRGLAADTECSFVPMEAVDESEARITKLATRLVGDVARGHTAFAEGDVLVARITPSMENGKCAIARDLRNGIGFGSTEFHVLRPLEGVTSEWLLYLWRYAGTRELAAHRMTGSAGQQRVPEAFLESLSIPLPEVSEQRRLIRILDHAEWLVRLRRYVVELSDDVIRGSFLEMFSGLDDHFPLSPVEELAADTDGAIRTGPFGSQLLHSEFVDRGIAVLGIDNVVNNRFEWAERRFITPDKYRQLRRYTVHPGDVLVSIMGTCGRCAIVPDDIPLAVNTKHLCCITLDSERCSPIYLQAALLHHPHVQRAMGAGRGAIMDGLNMQMISALPIPVPPKSLQQRFAAVSDRHHALDEHLREGLRLSQHAFGSLLNQVFGSVEQLVGDTQPSWIEAMSHA